MANRTTNIGLVKPDHAEFTDSWDIPVNNNFDIIDEEIGNLNSLTDDAKGTQTSLAARLDVSLNSDGSLKDIPEVAAARNSTVYGADTGSVNFSLDERLEQGDREVFDARYGSSTLSSGLAFLSDDFVPNSVVSGPTNFLTFTGASLKLDGSVTPLVVNINGYKRAVRRLMQTTVSGAAGTYYVYLDSNLGGEVVLDMTAAPNNTGYTSLNVLNKLAQFNDATQNFIASGVQAGDILEITTTGSVNKYQYVIASVDSANALTIKGWFASSQTGLNYKITNPLAPTMGVTDTAHAKRFARVAGRIYVGRCVFDGANITSAYGYAPKGRFENWYSVSLSGGNYEITALHGLGYVPTKISIYASQMNDFSQAIEPIATTLISGSGVSDDKAAIVDITDTTIRIKNATNGVFYKSYSGVSQTSGYLLVVAER